LGYLLAYTAPFCLVDAAAFASSAPFRLVAESSFASVQVTSGAPLSDPDEGQAECQNEKGHPRLCVQNTEKVSGL
jgi:hypothetical protein